VDADTLDDALENLQPATALGRGSFFANVDTGLWRTYFETETRDGKQA
jgi:hypothetical protein